MAATSKSAIANGTALFDTSRTRPLTGGVYAPVVTPFDGAEELDIEAWRRHIVRIGKAGAGLCVLGTNGEATHLTAAERAEVIAQARNALDEAGVTDARIIAGAGAGSAKETVLHCKAAAKGGADAAIVIFPGYYGVGASKDAIKAYFTKVCDESPIPVVLYNFPKCAGGVDLDSDILIELSQHTNVCGVKLTCAQVGKGGRVAAAIKREPFHVMTGFGDIMFPGMLVGFTGCITGSANVAPRTIVHLHNLTASALKTGDFAKLREAQKLSELVARADWAGQKGGIAGAKWALDRYYYPYGVPRNPLPSCSPATAAMLEEGFQQIMQMEREAERQAGVEIARS